MLDFMLSNAMHHFHVLSSILVIPSILNYTSVLNAYPTNESLQACKHSLQAVVSIILGFSKEVSAHIIHGSLKYITPMQLILVWIYNQLKLSTWLIRVSLLWPKIPLQNWLLCKQIVMIRYVFLQCSIDILLLSVQYDKRQCYMETCGRRSFMYKQRQEFPGRGVPSFTVTNKVVHSNAIFALWLHKISPIYFEWVCFSPRVIPGGFIQLCLLECTTGA